MKIMNIIRYKDPRHSLWAPKDRFSNLRDEVNRLLDGSLAGFVGNVGLFGGWSPAIDVSQDKDKVFVSVELPGMKKEEIEVSLHEGVLTIAGEIKKEKTEKGKGESFREERYYGRFHRSVTLPTEVDGSKVAATYHDGILEIELPKAEAAKPKQIEVKIA